MNDTSISDFWTNRAYGWSTDIGGLAILDGTGLLDRDGRVRIEEIRRQLEPRLDKIRRFRQLLWRPRLGLGWPLWVDAPSFDIADHVRCAIHAKAPDRQRSEPFGPRCLVPSHER